jgi:hypothetical protein
VKAVVRNQGPSCHCSVTDWQLWGVSFNMTYRDVGVCAPDSFSRLSDSSFSILLIRSAKRMLFCCLERCFSYESSAGYQNLLYIRWVTALFSLPPNHPVKGARNIMVTAPITLWHSSITFDLHSPSVNTQRRRFRFLRNVVLPSSCNMNRMPSQFASERTGLHGSPPQAPHLT